MIPELLALATSANVPDWVRLRMEGALLLGLFCLVIFCWRAGPRAAAFVAAIAWIGAVGFLVIEMDQLALHVLVGGGERLLFEMWLCDAIAAMAKWALVAALGAALVFAACATGGRGREIHRLVLSALCASFCVASVETAMAISLLLAAHVANAGSGSMRQWRSSSYAIRFALAAALVAIALSLLLPSSTLTRFERDPSMLSAAAPYVAALWMMAFAAVEWHYSTPQALAALGIGAPRFWSEVGLRLALFACAWRFCIHLGFDRSSAAAFVASPRLRAASWFLGGLAIVLMSRSHWLRWRAPDLGTWTRQTLCGMSAWIALALACLSGAGLRAAAIGSVLFAMMGMLLHAALAIARREPDSRAPWFLCSVSLLLSLPLPHSLAEYAYREVWITATRAGLSWLAVLLLLLCGAGWCGGVVRLFFLMRHAQPTEKEREFAANVRWPQWISVLLTLLCIAVAALARPLDQCLRSGRLVSSELAGEANRDDFLGRRYERASASN